MSNQIRVCELCGEPMPEGEEMFKYHGYSGPCPKPPLPSPSASETEGYEELAKEIDFLIHRHRGAWLDSGGKPLSGDQTWGRKAAAEIIERFIPTRPPSASEEWRTVPVVDDSA